MVYSGLILSSSFVFSSVSFLAEKYFDPQPSCFDTLSNSTGCLEIVIHPVRAKDLDAKKTNGSSVKPGNPKISKATEHSQGTASETRAVKGG